MTLYNYIWRRSYGGVAFAEFDRNPNFVPCWIDFICDEIEHSLMQQLKTIKLIYVFLIIL
jgi:hypothetical protein